MKRKFISVMLMGLFFFMLMNPNETFHGASEGLLLWFQIVLPTLLPFLIMTNLLVQTNTIRIFAKLLSPVLSPLFGVSADASFGIVAGFLCGYPMGAKVTADLLDSRRITKSEAQYLLSFCNNTSPMFIMNYVVLRNLKREELLLPSLVILTLSPMLCSFLFRLWYPKKRRENAALKELSSTLRFDFQALDHTIMNGFEIITKVGGYIILFSTLVALAGQLPFYSKIWRFVLLPFMEITNGTAALSNAPLPFESKYVLMMALNSFGGICSVFQTRCMLDTTGISIIPYIIEKLITTIVTSFLAFSYVILF